MLQVDSAGLYTSGIASYQTDNGYWAVTPKQALAAETKGRDIRFPTGGIDASEQSSSYKSAANVVLHLGKFELVEIVDYIAAWWQVTYHYFG